MNNIDDLAVEIEQVTNYVGEKLLNKVVIVTMPNGDRYRIPCVVVARARAIHYSEKDAREDNLTDEQKKERYLEELKYTLENNNEIEDWLENNMDWDDVSLYARLLQREPPSLEQLNEGITNGEKEFVSE